MPTSLARRLLLLSTTTLAGILCAPVQAAFITNGGFESGFSGWTRFNQAGSEGTFTLQAGTSSPISLDAVPSSGSIAAMSDGLGPGSHVLLQNFTVTAPVAEARLVFDLFIANRASAFYAPITLDFATPTLNQQARVDILSGVADPFSTSAADIFQSIFRTNVGDQLISGYTRYSVDITTLVNNRLNTPMTLRFAETDNVFSFQLGIDNVDIQVVPEPSIWILTAGGLAGVLWRRRNSVTHK